MRTLMIRLRVSLSGPPRPVVRSSGMSGSQILHLNMVVTSALSRPDSSTCKSVDKEHDQNQHHG